MLIDFTDGDNVVKRAVALGREGDLSQATAKEIDEILYWFEAPWNRYHASGFPLVFADPHYTREWKRRREYITSLYDKAQEPIRLQRAARNAVRGLAAGLEASLHVVCNFNVRVWAVSDGK
jgi:hypothetical protein